MSYAFQEFPKWVFSEIKKDFVIVKDAVEEALHIAKPAAKSTAPVAPAPLSLKPKPVDD